MDGSLLAYGVKDGGEDRMEISILHVPMGAHLPDHLETGYARGFVFAPSNDGFYYCHETGDDAAGHQILLHRFGQSPAKDSVILEVPRTPESRLTLIADRTRLGAAWLHPDESEMTVDFSIATISKNVEWNSIFANRKMPHTPILCQGMILALTQGESGAFRIVELSEDGRPLRTIVPDRPIRQIAITRNRIYVNDLEDSVFKIHGWSLAGESLGEIDLPADGTIRLLGNQTQDEDSFFYSYESFGQPPSIWEYTCSTETSAFWRQQISPAKERSIQVRNVSYPSKDGTEIPLTLVSLEEKDPNDPAPVLMTGYGGFGVPMTPQYSVLVTTMMEFGAVFALPHIRGGGEFGEPWHEAGRARSRQNAFDDFLCAGDWLYAQGIAAPKRIGIFGGSNSGLLVAVAMTQRPDLFGAVLSIAPLLDMVRYESFDRALKLRREYGTVNDAEDFRVLYGYSPYHRIEDNVDYPPMMFVSGDKDDRCNPAHVRKMAALLQNRDAGRSRVIVDYSEQRGHSRWPSRSRCASTLSSKELLFCLTS